MQKCARLTRHVESSMIRLTGTRLPGLTTRTPAGDGEGRCPGIWARASVPDRDDDDARPRPPANPAAFQPSPRPAPALARNCRRFSDRMGPSPDTADLETRFACPCVRRPYYETIRRGLFYNCRVG